VDAVARLEIGGVAGCVEVLAGPAADGQLDVRAAFDAQPRTAATRGLRPADLGAVAVLLRHHRARLPGVDRGGEAADSGSQAGVGVRLARAEAEPLDVGEVPGQVEPRAEARERERPLALGRDL